MNRRDTVLAILTLAASSKPLRSFAQQQGKIWRIGFLGLRSKPTVANPDYFDSFIEGMRDHGYVEGRNLLIESRFADGNYSRLPGLAAELVREKVDLIVTHGDSGTKAARRATGTIPIVTLAVTDPIGSGIAVSVANPGMNVTGLSLLGIDVSQKQLDLLKTLRPKLSRVALLVNPTNSAHVGVLQGLQATAQSVGITVLVVEATNSVELDRAFEAAARARSDALVVAPDAFIIGQFRKMAGLAIKHHLASIAPWREYVAAGGLLSYGQNLAEYYRRGGYFVDKIFKGAKPGELPIEQPTKIHMAINRRTAKALGLTIPQELLLRADEVIQ